MSAIDHLIIASSTSSARPGPTFISALGDSIILLIKINNYFIVENIAIFQ